MKVILPVAGKGTRLWPHTHTKAKSLVSVAGKTVLEHIVSRLATLEVSDFIFIVDDQGEQIQDFMDKMFPHLSCRYVVQTERKGPAHAVWLAHDYCSGDEDLLVVFNDTIFETDLTRVTSLCHDADGLIYSMEVEDYQRFGVNVMDGDFIVDMVEKPDTPVSNLAQVGLFYLRSGRRFMEYLTATIDADERVKGEFYLPPVFMRMIRDGCRLKAPTIDAWLDCGKPETLLETNAYLLKDRHHIHGEAQNCVFIEPVHVEKGARLQDCVIGPNVSVAAGAVLQRSIIRDSIINRDTRVRNMILTDTILGEAVQLVSSERTMNIGDHSLVDMQG